MRRLIRFLALIAAASFASTVHAQTTPTYVGNDNRTHDAQGVFCPDLTKCGSSGSGSGGAISAAANSYSTGFSPDVGKIADLAYTDLTGQASGGLVAIGKGEIVGLNAVKTALPARDTNGDLRTPTVTITPFYVALTANTSTTVLAASASRVGFDIQCATGGVALSRTGAALTSATPSSGGADLVIPATANAYFTPQYASKTQAVTGYTATAQACWGVSYAQQ